MNMYHEPSHTVVSRRMGFGTALVLGLSGVVISGIAAGTGITLYGMRIFDQKSDSLVGLAGETIKNLPEYRKALPPALADAIDDVRDPGYRDKLDVSVKWIEGASNKRFKRAAVEITNKGDKTISLMSMRLVGMDSDGNPISEETAYAATPIQIEDEWRGPLLPRETRKFAVHCWDRDVASMTSEITDLRVWRDPAATTPAREEKSESE